MEFRSYWFATGTPTFLIELLKKSDYDLRRLESIEIDESQFTSYRAGNTDPIPVIYQSGYLTIKGYDERFRIYKLGFPNDDSVLHIIVGLRHFPNTHPLQRFRPYRLR